MTLYAGGKRILDSLEADGNQAAVEQAQRRITNGAWALYHVQRIYYARGCAHRKVTALATGAHQEMLDLLEDREAGDPTEWAMGSPRRYVRRRQKEYPTREEFYVPAPAVVADKCRSTFDRRWSEMTAAQLSLPGYTV